MRVAKPQEGHKYSIVDGSLPEGRRKQLHSLLDGKGYKITTSVEVDEHLGLAPPGTLVYVLAPPPKPKPKPAPKKASRNKGKVAK